MRRAVTQSEQFRAFVERLRAFMTEALEGLDAAGGRGPGPPPVEHPSAEGTVANAPGAGAGAAEARFNALAAELFALQYAAVPPYRRYCDACGVRPAAVTRWQELPAVPATAFAEYVWSSLDEGARGTVFVSSGTTGERRSRHYHDAESLDVYARSAVSWFARCLGLRPGRQQRVLLLTPSLAEAPQSSLVFMLDAIGRVWAKGEALVAGKVRPDGSWHVDAALLGGGLDAAASGADPVMVVGTAFLFVQFLDACREAGRSWTLPPGSSVVETGGYKGRVRAMPREELYGQIGGTLGIPQTRIVSEYGMCELSTQAYDRALGETAQDGRLGDGEGEGSRAFQFAPWARWRIVSPETLEPVRGGEAGLIQVVDLANVRSVLAIATQDLGTRSQHGFALLGRAAQAEDRGCSRLTV